MQRRAVVALGSNLGSRAALLDGAEALLRERPELELLARGPTHETPPVGPPQPAYFNSALLLRTALPPPALLALLLETEARLGRVRTETERNGPRTVDLDLLWLEGEAHGPPDPLVPHPRLRERPFALRPLCALVPEARDPRDGALYADLLAALPPDGARPVEPCATDALEHAADEGFVVRGPDRAEVLAAGAMALGALLVDPRTVRPRELVSLQLEAPGAPEERWHQWLSEVLYALDAGRFALARAAVLREDEALLVGQLWGEPLDEAAHGLRGAVKAITWHELYLGPETDGRILGRVLVDV